MTKIVSGNSKNKMQENIVCISDDEEKDEQNKTLNATTNKMKSLAFHYNVYENSYNVPESARKVLEMFQKQKEQQQRIQQRPTTDLSKESVVYVPDDVEEEIQLIGPIRKFSRQILFGNKLTESPAVFPYNVLLDLEKHLTKLSSKNVSLTTETNVWKYTMEQLSCVRLQYADIYDLKSDEKYNLIVIRILGLYVNFRSRITAANRTLVKDDIRMICEDVWLQLETILSNNFMRIMMVLLRTDAKDYPLDVVLYPLFEKVHDLMLMCERHMRQIFPKILVFIITVLFYKHWQLMFTEKEDRERHIKLAKLSICKYFQKMPENIEKKYEGFIRRIDDRIHQSAIYKTTAYQLFSTKFEVTVAIKNFFREYDNFVFKCTDSDIKTEKFNVRKSNLLRPNGNNSSNNNNNNQLNSTINNRITCGVVNKQPNQHSTNNRLNQLSINQQNNGNTCFKNILFNSSSSRNNNINNINNFNSFKIANNLTANDTICLDDDDDIVIVNSPETPSRSNNINHFDENANFSSSTPSTIATNNKTQNTNSNISNNGSIERLRDNINCTNFSDSMNNESNSNSFHGLFTAQITKHSNSDSGSNVLSSLSKPRDDDKNVALADTTYKPANAKIKRLNGLRRSSDIKVSSTESVNETPKMRLPSLRVIDTKLLLRSSSDSFSKTNIISAGAESSSDKNCDDKQIQPQTPQSVPKTSLYESLSKMVSSSVVPVGPQPGKDDTRSDNSPEREVPRSDSMSPCSLEAYGPNEPESLTNNFSIVFNRVPSYPDPPLKFRSASPYFEQQHRNEQLNAKRSISSSDKNQNICDSNLNKETNSSNDLATTSTVASVIAMETVSSSTSIAESTTALKPAIENRLVEPNDQLPSTSSNENFAATIVDSGIASPADEAGSKDTLINVPTSTITDDSASMQSTATSKALSKDTPTQSISNIKPSQDEAPSSNNESITNSIIDSNTSTPIKSLSRSKFDDHLLLDNELDEFRSNVFNKKSYRRASLFTELSSNDGYDNFIDVLYRGPTAKSLENRRKSEWARVAPLNGSNKVVPSVSIITNKVFTLETTKARHLSVEPKPNEPTDKVPEINNFPQIAVDEIRQKANEEKSIHSQEIPVQIEKMSNESEESTLVEEKSTDVTQINETIPLESHPSTIVETPMELDENEIENDIVEVLVTTKKSPSKSTKDKIDSLSKIEIPQIEDEQEQNSQEFQHQQDSNKELMHSSVEYETSVTTKESQKDIENKMNEKITDNIELKVVEEEKEIPLKSIPDQIENITENLPTESEIEVLCVPLKNLSDKIISDIEMNSDKCSENIEISETTDNKEMENDQMTSNSEIIQNENRSLIESVIEKEIDEEHTVPEPTENFVDKIIEENNLNVIIEKDASDIDNTTDVSIVENVKKMQDVQEDVNIEIISNEVENIETFEEIREKDINADECDKVTEKVEIEQVKRNDTNENEISIKEQTLSKEVSLSEQISEVNRIGDANNYDIQTKMRQTSAEKEFLTKVNEEMHNKIDSLDVETYETEVFVDEKQIDKNENDEKITSNEEHQEKIQDSKEVDESSEMEHENVEDSIKKFSMDEILTELNETNATNADRILQETSGNEESHEKTLTANTSEKALPAEQIETSTTTRISTNLENIPKNDASDTKSETNKCTISNEINKMDDVSLLPEKEFQVLAKEENVLESINNSSLPISCDEKSSDSSRSLASPGTENSSEKKNRGAGRRTKPTKTVKLNNINGIALHATVSQINNLNMLVEIALADKINDPDVSLTMKSIEEISDEAQPAENGGTESSTKTEAVAQSEIIAETEPEIVAQKETMAGSEIVVETETIAKTEIVAQKETITGSEIIAETEPIAEAEIFAQKETMAGSEIVVETETIAKTEIVAQKETMAGSEIVAETETEIVADSETMTERISVIEIPVPIRLERVQPIQIKVNEPVPVRLEKSTSWEGDTAEEQILSDQPSDLSKKKSNKRHRILECSLRKSPRNQTKHEEIYDAMAKLLKMTEKKPATIFRAVDTIKEIIPCKARLLIPEEVNHKSKSNETYIIKPVREKSLKSMRWKKGQTESRSKSKTPSPATEKRSTRSQDRNRVSESKEADEKQVPEILRALNLSENKNSSKRKCSEKEIADLLNKDESKSNVNTCKRPKIGNVTPETELLKLNGENTHLEIENEKPTSVAMNGDANTLRLHESCTKQIPSPFTTPAKDTKPHLTNGFTETEELLPNKCKESEENKHMSPLVMKKTFECKCNSDRDRIIKRMKEFDQKLPSHDHENDVVSLITESVPNDYMETLTTLIKLKKIFFQRFVYSMKTNNVGVPFYLVQIEQQLTVLSQSISIDNKIFDDISELYTNLKDQMKTKNTNNTTSLQIFKNFDKFLKWWTRKFKCYCTPLHNKKHSKKFYDTEESISSDSNSQDRNYSPAKHSPGKMHRRIDDIFSPPLSLTNGNDSIDSSLNDIPIVSPKQTECESFSPIIPISDLDSQNDKPVTVTQIPLENEAEKGVEQKSVDVHDESIEEKETIESETIPIVPFSEPIPTPTIIQLDLELPNSSESEPSLPIDAANTIISFGADSIDIEITTTSPIDSKSVSTPASEDKKSPMYESEDSLQNLLPMTQGASSSDTMNFPDQLAQLNIQADNSFGSNSSISMYMDQDITLPLLPDVNNDALVSSQPQKLNEIMLQNEIDNYGDDNIFGDFKREYVHCSDPTMGPNKKGYAERPLPVEQAVFTLVDNDLTRISSLNNDHFCAPLKEILDPSRIPKKDSNRSTVTNANENTLTNNWINNSGNSGNNDSLFENSFEAMSFEDMVDNYDCFDDNMLCFDVLLNNVQNNIDSHNQMPEAIVDENKVLALPIAVPLADIQTPSHVSECNADPIETLQTNDNIIPTENSNSNGEPIDQGNDFDRNFDDIIEYDPHVVTHESINGLKESKSNEATIIATSPIEQSKQSIEDFSFKQPSPYPNGSSKSHSTKHSSSKSHKSKRKHHHDTDSDSPSKKHKTEKYDTIKDHTSSSSSSSSSHSNSNTNSNNNSGSNHKKSPHQTYIVKNITYVRSVPPTSKSETKHDDTKSIKHHNGTDKNSNNEIGTSKILKIKIKNLPPEDLSKSSGSLSTTIRRDGKKYHVSTNSMYDDSINKKHPNSRKNSGSSGNNRGLGKSNHWRAQMHYN